MSSYLKTCPRCFESKFLYEFHKNKWRKDGYAVYCKKCKSAERRQHYKDNLLKVRKQNLDYWRKIRYGVEPETFEKMLEEQNGLCFLCLHPNKSSQNGVVKQLCVDHCHETGKIRRLLCDRCNKGLGHLKDDPNLLRKAADYLEQYK